MIDKEQQAAERRRLWIVLQALVITWMVMLLLIRLVNYYGSFMPIRADVRHNVRTNR